MNSCKGFEDMPVKIKLDAASAEKLANRIAKTNLLVGCVLCFAGVIAAALI